MDQQDLTSIVQLMAARSAALIVHCRRAIAGWYDQWGNSYLHVVIEGNDKKVYMEDSVVRGLRPFTNNVDLVRDLIRLGCKVNQRNWSGDTPILCISPYTELNIVEMLLEAGANVHVRSRNKCDESPYALFRAIPNWKTMNLLLKAGINVNRLDCHGNSALHRTIQSIHEYPEAIQILVENGAKLFGRRDSYRR